MRLSLFGTSARPMLWVLAVVATQFCVPSAHAQPAREPAPAERAFDMGFTPFPFDATLEAVGFVREFLAANADIVAAHFEGTPWTEALSGEPFRRNLAESFESTKRAIPKGARVYLAVTPIGMPRSGMAAYRGDEEGLPIPEPFAGKPFDDPTVMEAYLSYCRRAVDYFQPDYLNIGIEANELFTNSPALWDGYVRLHQATYEALKAEHPDLPIFISFTLHDLLNADRTDEQRAAAVAAVRELMPHSDLVAISFYPFIGLLSSRIDECLRRVDEEFGDLGKPFAIAEMGEIAEPLRVESVNFTIPGDEETQRRVLNGMLQFAHGHDFRFMIWFVSRDYDALSERMGAGAPEIFRVWRDAGLLDGEGRERPAYDLWRTHFLLPRTERDAQ